MAASSTPPKPPAVKSGTPSKSSVSKAVTPSKASAVNGGTPAKPPKMEAAPPKSPAKKPVANGTSPAKPSAEAATPVKGKTDEKDDPKKEIKAHVLQPTSRLKSAQLWNIQAPPPVNSLKGHLMPSLLTKRRRRISVEVHTVFPTLPGTVAKKKQEGVLGSLGSKKDTPETEPGGFDECWIRVLVPKTKKAKKSMKKGHMEDATSVNGASDDIDDDDDASVADSVSLVQLESIADPDNLPTDHISGDWKAKYKIAVKDVAVNKRLKNCVVVTTQFKKFKQTRELTFDSEKEAIAFVNCIHHQKGMEEERSKAKLKAALGGISLKPNEQITLLIEICSAWDLPAADIFSSDPFVVASLNGRELHRTKHIAKTLEPVFTLKHDSLFLLSISARELFEAYEGMLFVIKDFDQFGGNETLGAVSIPPKVLYEAKGERMIYSLKGVPGKKDYGKGSLAIRCRHATDNDKRFMENYEADAKPKDSTPAKAGGKGTLKSIVSKSRKIEKVGDVKVERYRVRPHPDPKRKEETTWLTEEQVEAETMKESYHWTDIGTGKLGRVFLEVLGCNNLPNLDTGGFLGNKTDAFVSIVFEDAVVQTDVIDDSLSPRWLPWSNRAFIFHMMHGSSDINLGVFDFDTGLDDHDLIGRVSVDLSKLRPGTEYLLDYNIFPTAKMSDRKALGTIHIRLRMELEDPRALLLATVQPPPDIYVNVKKKKDFRVVRYTCTGKYDMDKYSMKTLSAYIEELMAYEQIKYYLEDAVMTLLLWRGTVPFLIPVPDFSKSEEEKASAKGTLDKYTKKVEIFLPIHSLTAFLIAILIVERPSLFPSFFFASIGWMLIAVMDWRVNTPNPWARCKSFTDIAQMLILGKNPSPHDIKEFENQKESVEFMERMRKRVEEAEKAAKEELEKAEKRQEELEKEMEEIGEENVDIATKSSGIGVSIDPFKPILFPIQQYLGILCDGIRFAKYVILWEECYFSFWIAFGSLILSFSCLFVPWAFLIRWTSRIVVWVVFGPWMKAVDVYYVSKLKPLTEEEKEEKEKQESLKRHEATQAAAMEARIKREDASKLKAMKKYLFGKFITKVPVLKMDRFRDHPLPSSIATPYKPKAKSMSELAMEEAGRNRTRIGGQHLVGDMIPTVEMAAPTEAPIGQATKHKELLEEEDPAAKVAGGDSTTAAYAKIGSVVVAAGLVTWFGVPFFVSAIKWTAQGKFLSFWG